MNSLGKYSDGLRTQKVTVALYNEKCEAENVTVVLKDDQEECVIPIEKKDLAAVFPNAGDHGYFLLCFDEKSLQFFKHNTSVTLKGADFSGVENCRVH